MYQCQYLTIESSISECDHKCESWNAEPEIGTDWSSMTRRNQQVDGHGSGFNPTTVNKSGFWLGLQPNQPVFAVQTRTAGGYPGPIANPTPIDRLQVLRQSHSMMTSKCIYKLTWSQCRSASLSSIDQRLKSRSIMASKFARSWPSERISNPAQSRPPSSYDHGLQAHLQACSIMASKCISEIIWSSSPGEPRIILNHRLQPIQIYCVWMGSYINT